MKALGLIFYLVLGLVQFFATIAGLQVALGTGLVVNIVLSLLVAWLPMIGTITAIYGAIVGWGWPWVWALAVFGGPVVVLMLLGVIAMWLDSPKRA